ncbi:MAG TPA: hypothetical protein VHX38_15440 [Pseudonocardiaceae bacterium]|nr:hypothetical protein [Pseudonocardiaceae bacterium]
MADGLTSGCAVLAFAGATQPSASVPATVQAANAAMAPRLHADAVIMVDLSIFNAALAVIYIT